MPLPLHNIQLLLSDVIYKRETLKNTFQLSSSASPNEVAEKYKNVHLIWSGKLNIHFDCINIHY